MFDAFMFAGGVITGLILAMLFGGMACGFMVAHILKEVSDEQTDRRHSGGASASES